MTVFNPTIQGGSSKYYIQVHLSTVYSGLTITATPTSGSSVSATTDANGMATLEVKGDTTYTVTGSASGYYFSSSSVTTSSAVTDITLTCYKYPIVTVTVTDSSSSGYQSGRVITATNGGTTYSGTTDSSGVATITIQANSGTWTLGCSNMPTGGSASWSSSTVSVSAGGTYSRTMTIGFGYGYAAVDIAISTSDPSTRCTYPQTITVNGSSVANSCYGFSPMAGSTSGTFSVGGWSGHKILEGIKPVSKNGSSWSNLGTNAANWSNNSEGTDYFTEFPFQWLSITNNGTRIRIIFSDKDARPDSTFQCYAHAKGCDSYSNSQIESAMSSASRTTILASNNNSYFANSFHIGCFPATGSDSAIYSRKGSSLSPTRSIAYANYWKAANARGTDYDCMSFQQWTYLQALFVLLFKSTNSQASHSAGYTGGSSVQNNAGLSTTAYGMAGTIGGTTTRMAFFWIHDLWGNMYQFIGGAWNRAGSSSKLYYWLPRQANSRAFNNGWSAASSYATQTSLGDDTGLTGSNSGGYIYSTAGTNKGGFCPTSQSGASETTFWCDRGYVNYDSSRAFFPYVGGNYDGGTYAGVFFCYVSNSSTTSYSYRGSRLSYRGGH